MKRYINISIIHKSCGGKLYLKLRHKTKGIIKGALNTILEVSLRIEFLLIKDQKLLKKDLELVIGKLIQ